MGIWLVIRIIRRCEECLDKSNNNSIRLNAGNLGKDCRQMREQRANLRGARWQNLLGNTKTSHLTLSEPDWDPQYEYFPWSSRHYWVALVLVNHWDSCRGWDSREALETLAVLLTPTESDLTTNRYSAAVSAISVHPRRLSLQQHTTHDDDLSEVQSMSQSFLIVVKILASTLSLFIMLVSGQFKDRIYSFICSIIGVCY